MASTKQQTYRRLMKEQKSKSSSSPQRIQSPIARYNSLGQLSCVVCEVPIKSEVLWAPHIQSRKHKECLAALKAKAKSGRPSPANSTAQHEVKQRSGPGDTGGEFIKPTLPPVTTKRKLSEHDTPNETDIKRLKENDSAVTTPTGLPKDFFDSSNKTVISDTEKQSEVSSKQDELTKLSSHPDLPSDFFDQQDTVSSAQDTDKTNNLTKKGDLPEGFFDDPKIDAKVRKVEYVDPQEAQWEEFQKSMQKESEASEAILQVGDEETQVDRELMEVNEQVACFQRAEILRQKQEKLTEKREIDTKDGVQLSTENTSSEIEIKQENSDSSSDDDEDIDQLLDWRSKLT